LADQAACYWLFDLIVSYINLSSFADQDFVTVKLQRESWGAVITIVDGNENLLAKQAIDYTDFPLDSIALYGCRLEQHWIIMLPREY
jgi:hypothetical protein